MTPGGGLTDLLETPSIAGYAFRGVTSEGVFPFVREINLEDLSVTNAKIRDATIESAKIADLAVTNAKIASLAVTDAKIASLVADKITTGNLVATVSVTSGVLQTAAAGARVKLSSAGVELFNSANVRKVFLDAATGDAEFAGKLTAGTIGGSWEFTGGTIKTALSGARVELGENGIEIYESDGALALELNATDGLIVYTKTTDDTKDGIRWFRDVTPLDAFPFLQLVGSRTAPASLRLESVHFATGARHQALVLTHVVDTKGEFLRIGPELTRFASAGFHYDNAFRVTASQVAAQTNTGTINVTYTTTFHVDVVNVAIFTGPVVAGADSTRQQFWVSDSITRSGCSMLGHNHDGSTVDLRCFGMAVAFTV